MCVCGYVNTGLGIYYVCKSSFINVPRCLLACLSVYITQTQRQTSLPVSEEDKEQFQRESIFSISLPALIRPRFLNFPSLPMRDTKDRYKRERKNNTPINAIENPMTKHKMEYVEGENQNWDDSALSPAFNAVDVTKNRESGMSVVWW